jgi:hypothetical protein
MNIQIQNTGQETYDGILIALAYLPHSHVKYLMQLSTYGRGADRALLRGRYWHDLRPF